MVLTVSPGNLHWRHRSANGQSQNERPTHVLHKPDKIISYRQANVKLETVATMARAVGQDPNRLLEGVFDTRAPDEGESAEA